MSQSIWYLLADAKGDPLPGTNATRAFVPADGIVADLRKAVWNENRVIMDQVVASGLMVYQNKEATTALGPAKGVGALYDDPVTIAVPQTRCKLTHSCLLLTLTI